MRMAQSVTLWEPGETEGAPALPADCGELVLW